MAKRKRIIAGVDEVGRGPLIGAVVTCAVVLDPKHEIHGLTDSKVLSEKKRLMLEQEIKERALAWSLGRAEAYEIDQINILQATMLAMQRAVGNLSIKPDHVLIDGNRCPELPCSSEAIVKGDQSVAVISAASILAKNARDREMYELDRRHPEYGFAKHKGYPTKLHFAAIEKYGILPEHRLSFKPVAKILERDSQ